MKLAIGYDLIERHTDGNPQSFSKIWKEYADERGVDAVVVDPLSPGALDVVRGCDAFIWRYNFRLPWTDAAPGIMRAIEDDFGLPVWPGRVLRETFENKVAQAYLLDALNIPHPRTWVFWRAAEALDRLDELPFPMVAKLSRGVRSEGVALIRDRAEAEAVIDRMFTFGLSSMEFLRAKGERRFGKYNMMLRAMRRGRFKGFHERGYVLFQEFIPGNAFDTRVVVQGDRITASRRRTREGDFRASGSGVSDFDPAAIDPAAMALAVKLAEAMKVSSLVADVIHRGTEPLINEFSYSMAIHVVRSMPAHWQRTPQGLVRVDAPLDWPRAIFDDFLADIGASAPAERVARTQKG